MPLGHHLVFSAYGFWLPNDPRGSHSEFVGSWRLYQHGPPTKTDEGRSVAGAPHDHELRSRTKAGLKYPAVKFDGLQARAIGRGFRTFLERSNVCVWACAILPDHVHLVTGPLGTSPQSLAVLLKQHATQQLEQEGIHPLARFKHPGRPTPKCWSRGAWDLYLDSEAAVDHAVKYVEDNPVKDGLPKQTWSFVTSHR